MTAQKSPTKIFKWITIYCENIAGGNELYFPLHGPIHLPLKFYTIVQDFERVLDYNCK